jgi:hypothetical protein
MKRAVTNRARQLLNLMTPNVRGLYYQNNGILRGFIRGKNE